ncbi:TIGR03086 family protein [Streptomyces sp. PSKA54]|uniref:TIGR03086 family protein n=1 Tax=Streptomyces himalayensis subsp. aureolus TaxID=2758039 RepID=A0A7W2D4J1_9ACTN|nr:TIGR03086 family metal-binding protein [Streptomyces himalayensis]MBA4864491.1 TIGR03086 family protein [Streptomyces himalayensis subsp. aureolus]
MSDIDTPASTVTGTHPVGELLGVAAERAVPVVRAIPDDQLTAPTPCADYDVRELVDHLFHVVVQFQALAAKKPADFSSTPDHVGAGPDWRERFAEETERLVAAWSATGAEEGTTGAMGLPARTVGCMVLLDLTVHAWDLARATGQEYRADPAATGVLHALGEAVAELAPTARKMGVFADPVPVPEEASDFERLLGDTGRDPSWSRP